MEAYGERNCNLRFFKINFLQLMVFKTPDPVPEPYRNPHGPKIMVRDPFVYPRLGPIENTAYLFNKLNSCGSFPICLILVLFHFSFTCQSTISLQFC